MEKPRLGRHRIRASFRLRSRDPRRTLYLRASEDVGRGLVWNDLRAAVHDPGIRGSDRGGGAHRPLARRSLVWRPAALSAPGRTPLDILQERFARGELD